MAKPKTQVVTKTSLLEEIENKSVFNRLGLKISPQASNTIVFDKLRSKIIPKLPRSNKRLIITVPHQAQKKRRVPRQASYADDEEEHFIVYIVGVYDESSFDELEEPHVAYMADDEEVGPSNNPLSS